MKHETEDGCSARTVREEMRGKDNRARRGKVGHLRDQPPNTNRTICGVNADSARTRIVSSADWLQQQELQCINCRRMLVRAALHKTPQQVEADFNLCRDGAELPHGIPEGENDPGWPDGTPEELKHAGA